MFTKDLNICSLIPAAGTLKQFLPYFEATDNISSWQILGSTRNNSWGDGFVLSKSWIESSTCLQ